MRNLKYFSFERNKYFYGKLLSVSDFETEQRYMNDKRRLINRFINGCGVACGMSVVIVDDMTIYVERGMALDFAGREIVIENPVTKKLSMLDGFHEYSDADEDGGSLYLCVGYQEENKEAVHSIAGSIKADTDDVEYNKYKEGYRLYLTNKEPESETIIYDSYYKDSRIIYNGNGFRIKQEIPQYLKSNEIGEIKVIVEKYGQSRQIRFQYVLEGKCIRGKEGGDILIDFDEEKYEKSSRYEMVYQIRTMPVIESDDKLHMKSSSFKLFVGKKSVSVNVDYESSIHVSQKDIRQQVIDSYYQSVMDDVVMNSYEQHIYLARLSVVKAGATYIIDSVENMPFNQYLLNNNLNTILKHMELEYCENNIVSGAGYSENKSVVKSNSANGQMIATGVAMIDLGIGGNAGQKFFSGEIVHGLGLGNVTITLGAACSARRNNSIVYGAQDIFSDEENTIKADLAAKTDPDTGKFIIGLKCLEATDERQAKVHWMAVKDKQEVVYEKVKNTMYIKPDMLNLKTKESHYYEAVISGENESRVRWSVKEENGGTIDENGMYTAPNRQGVFEIIAESMDHPDMKASTFVVVRDKK